MIEAGQSTGFASESVSKTCLPPGLRRQDFEGHQSVQGRLASPIHGAHPSLPQQLLNLQLRKKPRDLRHCRRHKTWKAARLSGRWGRAGAEAGLHQTGRTQPLRRVGRQRLVTDWACGFSAHDCFPSFF